MDIFSGVWKQIGADPLTTIGLMLGGVLIGIGFSSFYWSYRWRQMDHRLETWERFDLALKKTLGDWISTRACASISPPEFPEFPESEPPRGRGAPI